MPPFKIADAVRESGKAKSTIIDAIKRGRLSATRDETGRYLIDPSELFRVYPAQTHTTESDTVTRSAHGILELKTAMLEQALERERDFVRELSRRLDESDAERRRLTELLTFDKAQAPQANAVNKLWRKVFKRHQL